MRPEIYLLTNTRLRQLTLYGNTINAFRVKLAYAYRNDKENICKVVIIHFAITDHYWKYSMDSRVIKPGISNEDVRVSTLYPDKFFLKTFSNEEEALAFLEQSIKMPGKDWMDRNLNRRILYTRQLSSAVLSHLSPLHIRYNKFVKLKAELFSLYDDQDNHFLYKKEKEGN